MELVCESGSLRTDKSSMMDTDNITPMSGNGDLENGHRKQNPISVNINGTSDAALEIEGLAENFENAIELNVEKTLNSGQEYKEDPSLPPGSCSNSNSKESGVQKPDEQKILKPQEGMKRVNNGKASSTGKDGKVVKKSSNGIIASAFGTKSKSSNEGQSAIKGQQEHHQHGPPGVISSSTKGEQPEELKKTKLKTLTKGIAGKDDEIAQSSINHTAVEAKPLKLGTLPTYSFSFKCNERAEKRKEFYSKLEEKIQAKEAEKSDLQAKTKETQEAEIKMLRKSLGFKATPMPSFYQEPPPPKAELKKIPTTRAKSPKLGRKKSSTSPTVGAKDIGPHPSRLSLDEKLSQSNLARAARDGHVKKPQRKSLPKLPCEDNALSYEKKNTSSSSTKTDISHKKTVGNEAQLNVLAEEGSTAAGPIEGQLDIDEKHPEETVKVQETVAA